MPEQLGLTMGSSRCGTTGINGMNRKKGLIGNVVTTALGGVRDFVDEAIDAHREYLANQKREVQMIIANSDLNANNHRKVESGEIPAFFSQSKNRIHEIVERATEDMSVWLPHGIKKQELLAKANKRKSLKEKNGDPRAGDSRERPRDSRERLRDPRRERVDTIGGQHTDRQLADRQTTHSSRPMNATRNPTLPAQNQLGGSPETTYSNRPTYATNNQPVHTSDQARGRMTDQKSTTRPSAKRPSDVSLDDDAKRARTREANPRDTAPNKYSTAPNPLAGTAPNPLASTAPANAVSTIVRESTGGRVKELANVFNSSHKSDSTLWSNRKTNPFPKPDPPAFPARKSENAPARTAAEQQPSPPASSASSNKEAASIDSKNSGPRSNAFRDPKSGPSGSSSSSSSSSYKSSNAPSNSASNAASHKQASATSGRASEKIPSNRPGSDGASFSREVNNTGSASSNRGGADNAVPSRGPSNNSASSCSANTSSASSSSSASNSATSNSAASANSRSKESGKSLGKNTGVSENGSVIAPPSIGPPSRRLSNKESLHTFSKDSMKNGSPISQKDSGNNCSSTGRFDISQNPAAQLDGTRSLDAAGVDAAMLQLFGNDDASSVASGSSCSKSVMFSRFDNRKLAEKNVADNNFIDNMNVSVVSSRVDNIGGTVASSAGDFIRANSINKSGPSPLSNVDIHPVQAIQVEEGYDANQPAESIKNVSRVPSANNDSASIHPSHRDESLRKTSPSEPVGSVRDEIASSREEILISVEEPRAASRASPAESVPQQAQQELSRSVFSVQQAGSIVSEQRDPSVVIDQHESHMSSSVPSPTDSHVSGLAGSHVSVAASHVSRAASNAQSNQQSNHPLEGPTSSSSSGKASMQPEVVQLEMRDQIIEQQADTPMEHAEQHAVPETQPELPQAIQPEMHSDVEDGKRKSTVNMDTLFDDTTDMFGGHTTDMLGGARSFLPSPGETGPAFRDQKPPGATGPLFPQPKSIPVQTPPSAIDPRQSPPGYHVDDRPIENRFAVLKPISVPNPAQKGDPTSDEKKKDESPKYGKVSELAKRFQKSTPGSAGSNGFKPGSSEFKNAITPKQIAMKVGTTAASFTHATAVVPEVLDAVTDSKQSSDVSSLVSSSASSAVSSRLQGNQSGHTSQVPSGAPSGQSSLKHSPVGENDVFPVPEASKNRINAMSVPSVGPIEEVHDNSTSLEDSGSSAIVVTPKVTKGQADGAKSAAAKSAAAKSAFGGGAIRINEAFARDDVTDILLQQAEAEERGQDLERPSSGSHIGGVSGSANVASDQQSNQRSHVSGDGVDAMSNADVISEIGSHPGSLANLMSSHGHDSKPGSAKSSVVMDTSRPGSAQSSVVMDTSRPAKSSVTSEGNHVFNAKPASVLKSEKTGASRPESAYSSRPGSAKSQGKNSQVDGALNTSQVVPGRSESDLQLTKTSNIPSAHASRAHSAKSLDILSSKPPSSGAPSTHSSAKKSVNLDVASSAHSSRPGTRPPSVKELNNSRQGSVKELNSHPESAKDLNSVPGSSVKNPVSAEYSNAHDQLLDEEQIRTALEGMAEGMNEGQSLMSSSGFASCLDGSMGLGTSTAGFQTVISDGPRTAENSQRNSENKDEKSVPNSMIKEITPKDSPVLPSKPSSAPSSVSGSIIKSTGTTSVSSSVAAALSANHAAIKSSEAAKLRKQQEKERHRALKDRRIAIRHMKRPEDNYDVSDKCSTDEESPDRRHKKIPAWCKNWTEKVQQQGIFDPDTIFGFKVPNPDLTRIFGVNVRPKKRGRGSSENWENDRLTRREVDQYKLKVNQTREWSLNYGMVPK